MGRLEIVARPASREDRVEWDAWRHRWRVACRAPPTDGRANEAIVRILAEKLGVPRGGVRLAAGGRARTKLVEVDGVSTEEIIRRLSESSPPSDSGP